MTTVIVAVVLAFLILCRQVVAFGGLSNWCSSIAGRIYGNVPMLSVGVRVLRIYILRKWCMWNRVCMLRRVSVWNRVSEEIRIDCSGSGCARGQIENVTGT